MLENKLRSLEDLSRVVNQRDNIRYFRPEDLHPYHKHKFKEYDGTRFEDMVESVKAFGILQPVVVREYNGAKEILMGHNRTRAAAAADILVPTVVIDADDELADSIVRESNIYQRGFEELKLSEQAAILKDHFDLLKKSGKKKHFIENVENGAESYTRDLIAKDYGLSGRSISRKLRLNYLIPEFKEAVDNGKIPMKAAIDISYISREYQVDISFYFMDGYRITGRIASELRRSFEIDGLNDDIIKDIICDIPSEPVGLTELSEEELKAYLMDFKRNIPIWFTERRTGEYYRKLFISPELSIVVRSFAISDDEEHAEWFLLQPNCPMRGNETTVDDIVKILKDKKE